MLQGMTNTMRVIRPATTDGKISAVSMIVALVKSGVPMHNIALAQNLTETERAQVLEQLA